MQIWSKKKADTDLAQALSRTLGRQLDVDSQCLNDVRRTALRADAAVSVLGHAYTCAGSNERSGGGNVEGAAGVAPGPAGIDQGVILAFFCQRLASRSSHGQGFCGCNRPRRSRGADRFGESYNLLHSL